MSGGMSAAAIAGLALSAIGTGVAMYGQMQQADAASAAAKYQAQVAANNATIAKQNADATIEAGKVAEQQQRMKTAALIGSQRAAMAANGVRLDSGSALDIQSDTATMGELDALTVRNNAARQAWAYEAQATNFNAQSQLSNAQAGWAQSAGLVSGAGTLLGGASSFADKWATAKRDGVFK